MEVEFASVTWPIWQLVVVIVVVFFLGALLGFYSFSSESNQKIKDAQEKAEIAKEQAKGEIERAAARVAQAEQKAATTAAPPVSALPGNTLLRLWLDDRERPNLDIDGQQADTAPISEHNRKRLIALVTVMRPWIEGKSVATAPAPPAPAPAPAPRPITYTPTPPPAPVEMPSLSKSLANSVSNMLTVKKEEKPVAPLSIVGQIDEILQARIAGGPLASREIRLLESPEGGVIVAVGAQRFAGVGEVTDPQIQAELRAAIAEWEKKYTPGM